MEYHVTPHQSKLKLLSDIWLGCCREELRPLQLKPVSKVELTNHYIHLREDTQHGSAVDNLRFLTDLMPQGKRGRKVMMVLLTGYYHPSIHHTHLVRSKFRDRSYL